MIELTLNNDYTSVSSNCPKDVLGSIIAECSYTVPSAEWSTKFQTGVWDGKITLFSKKTMSFPSGLLDCVSNLLKSSDVEFFINDRRLLPKLTNSFKVDISPNKFRDYQEDAIKVIKEKTRGICSMATGSGKTKTAAGVISELSVYPVLFIVPSVSLLKQTIKEFNVSLNRTNEDAFIGEIGAGTCIISELGVNVATYQTALTAFDKKYSDQKKKIIDLEIDKVSLESLNKQYAVLQVDLLNSPAAKHKSIKKKIKDVELKIQSKKKMHEDKSRIRKLVETCQLLIIDENHIAAEIIECISLKAKSAYYKVGFSATCYRTDNQDIRMTGATGPIIHSVTSSDLIKRGFLVRPLIYTIDLSFIDKTSATYQETYKNAIVLNQYRNELIRDFATEMYSNGRPTLIMVERIEHGKILEGMIENSLFVPGSSGEDDKPIPPDELDYRRYQLDVLEKNQQIMIATSWCYTGIDAPKISCLILACSMASPVTTIQQIGRVLRPAEGKSDCVVIDFKMKEKSLRNHYNSRIKAYKIEKEFQIKAVKYNETTGLFGF